MNKNEEENLNAHGYSGHIELITELVNYGEKARIVKSSMYKELPDEILEKYFAKGGNRIAIEEYNNRQKEKQLAKASNGLDGKIDKYLHTSDTTFVKNEIKEGLGVFIKLSKPKSKRFLAKKKELTDRLNVLSINDLCEILVYYMDIKEKFDDYTIKELRSKFSKRVIITKDSNNNFMYKNQPKDINEKDIKDDLKDFIKIIESEIHKKEAGLFFNGKEFSLSCPEELESFLKNISKSELCRFLLENYNHLGCMDNRWIIDNIKENVEKEDMNRQNYEKNGKITKEESEERKYQAEQIKLILDGILSKLYYAIYYGEDVKELAVQRAFRELWRNEKLRKKYYLPELDDVILTNTHNANGLVKIYISLEDISSGSKYPFEIRLKALEKTNRFFSGILTDKRIYEDDKDDVSKEQIRMTLERMIDKMNDKQIFEFAEMIRKANCNKDIWIINVLYSRLLQQLIKVDSDGEFVAIIDEDQRKNSRLLIAEICKMSKSLDKHKALPEKIVKILEELEKRLKNISLGEVINQRKNPSVQMSASEIADYIVNAGVNGEITQDAIQAILDQMLKYKGDNGEIILHTTGPEK